jgi:hypothetical protein
MRILATTGTTPFPGEIKNGDLSTEVGEFELDAIEIGADDIRGNVPES